MKKKFIERKSFFFYGCIIVIGLLIATKIMWQPDRSKSQPSAFEAVWAKFSDLRIGATEQAAVDFSVVHNVMYHYACKNLDKFFEFYSPPYSSLSGRHAIQKARERTMPDVDCSTEVRVLGYSTPPVRFARFIAISTLPDKEAKQFADIVDAAGGVITSRERHLWKKLAFIEVSIGKHTLLTVWYHDGSDLCLTSFMGKQEVEELLQLRLLQRFAPSTLKN